MKLCASPSYLNQSQKKDFARTLERETISLKAELATVKQRLDEILGGKNPFVELETLKQRFAAAESRYHHLRKVVMDNYEYHRGFPAYSTEQFDAEVDRRIEEVK